MVSENTYKDARMLFWRTSRNRLGNDLERLFCAS